MQAEWPLYLSYDKSDQNIFDFYSKLLERNGALVDKHSIFYRKTQVDIFLLAMAIGKDLGHREKLKNASQAIKRDVLGQAETWLMCSVALDEDPELSTLADGKKIVKICEEYANAGIKALIKLDKHPGSIGTSEYERFLEEKLKM